MGYLAVKSNFSHQLPKKKKSILLFTSSYFSKGAREEILPEWSKGKQQRYPRGRPSLGTQLHSRGGAHFQTLQLVHEEIKGLVTREDTV